EVERFDEEVAQTVFEKNMSEEIEKKKEQLKQKLTNQKASN
ncbi:36253_t:CDS:1, partial [Gigaspora margarita]